MMDGASTVGNRAGFHGLEHDEAAGLLYVRNRWLDPELGRFLSPDPLGYADAPALYQAFLNNPVNHRDPLGLYIVGGAEEIRALKEALENVGVPHLARQLHLTSCLRPEYFRERKGALELDSRIVIVGRLSGWEEARSTSEELHRDLYAPRMLQGLADLVREAIETPYRVTFEITDEDLSEWGGAVTFTTYGQGFTARTHFWPDKPNESLIRAKVNPGQVEAARVPGDQGKIPVSLPAAVVHEFGHAYWYFHDKGSPEQMQIFPGPNNDRAVKMENRYRYLRRFFGEVLPMRSDH